MKRPHYSWIICIACMWMFITNMGLCSNILTVYLPFIEATGISGSMGSGIISVRCLASFLTTCFVREFYRRLSLRRGILIASIVGALFPIVFSLPGGIVTYYLGAVLAGASYGAGVIFPVSLLLNNWFHTHKGMAVGLSSAGSGLATMIFSPVLSSIVTRYSLRTAFLTQAVFMFISAAVIYLMIRDTPQEKGLEPYGLPPSASGSRKKIVSRPLPKQALFVLAVMMLLVGGAGLAFSSHLSILMVTNGYTTGIAAKAISVFGLVLIFSKFSAGEIADRIGAKKASIILFLIFISGCVSVLFMDGIHIIWCFILPVLVGFGASIYNVGPPLWASDLTSENYFADLLRWLQLFYNFGGIVFTILPGVIADHTGEYKSSYQMFAAMMLTALIILVWAYRKYYIPESERTE